VVVWFTLVVYAGDSDAWTVHFFGSLHLASDSGAIAGACCGECYFVMTKIHLQ
jgi:hypothetical protein